MAASSQELEEGIQSTDALCIGPRKRRTEGSWGLPTGQDVLNLAARKYLQKTETSKPEDLNGFVYYLEKVRKVEIEDVQPGSLIITLKCSSLRILGELWNDYCTGYVNEMARTFLATEDILNELGITEVKFTTMIPKEDYEACRKKLLDDSRLQRKFLPLKTLRGELQNQFCVWVSTRKHTRKLLKELETELEKEISSTRRRAEQSEVPRDPSGWSWSTMLGGIGAAKALVASASVALADGATVGATTGAARILHGSGAGAAGGGAGGRETQIKLCIEETDVCLAILEDIHKCRGLEIELNLLRSCLADFAVFCRDNIDSVLSSELLEGEYGFLLDILRGTHSPGAAVNAQVPLPVLLHEEVNIHLTRASTLCEQLMHSAANQEVLSITQQILRELREGPNDDEIRTMIMNFIEGKFAEACKS